MELNEELFSFRNPMGPEFTITLNKIVINQPTAILLILVVGLAASIAVTYFINLSTRQLERNGLVWFGSK